MMIEEAKYIVTLKLTNVVIFSPIERSTPLTRSDAINNAFGTMSDDFWAALKDEGWSIKSEAERIY